MVRSRLGLKALGLCALVVGLMAMFTSSAAQAEPGARWAIIKKSDGKLVTISPVDGEKGIGDELLPKIQIKEIEKLLKGDLSQHAVLLSKILGKKVEILCTSASLEDNKLPSTAGVRLLLNGSIEEGRAVFHGCVFLVEGVIRANCEPHTGEAKGLILTNPALGLIVLHKLAGGALDTLVRLRPETGETFVTVETSEACAFGAKIPIIGELFLIDSQNEFTKEKVDHLIEQDPIGINLTKLWVISKTEEHVANIDGSALVTLIGEHAGFEWGGLPA